MADEKTETLLEALDRGWGEQEEALAAVEEAPVETPEETPEEGVVAEIPEPEVLEAPEHWSDEDKETFNSLPEEARPLYLAKVTSLETGYNTKFESLADERKQLDAFKGFAEMFTPDHREQLARMGTTPEGYVRSLIATHFQLQQNPQATLQQLAQQLGVTLGEAPALEEDDLDPVVNQRLKGIESQLQSLAENLTQTQQSQEEASQRQIQETWQAFAGAKDDQGNVLYPNAEGLKTKIAYELQTLESIPRETAGALLKRAYDNVKWTDPALRQTILDAQAKAETDKAKAETDKAEAKRRESVEKAKRAGSDPKSKSGPVSEAPPEGESRRESLEREWDRMTA